MTGQDFQDKLDAIVVDLQTKGKGQQVQILTRDEENTANIQVLSSDVNGVVNALQLGNVQAFVDGLKGLANAYEAQRAIYTPALDAFNATKTVHQPLIDAAKVARDNLSNALAADVDYQNAMTALDAARNDPNYIAAMEAYRINNVSENFSNLSDARGKYLP